MYIYDLFFKLEETKNKKNQKSIHIYVNMYDFLINIFLNIWLYTLAFNLKDSFFTRSQISKANF